MKSEDILDVAFNEFSKYGIKRVSVDEIAQKLKISKKTIYEFFSGKDELIIESFRYRSAIQSKKFSAIMEKYSSPLEIIVRGGLENFKFFYPISDAYKEDLHTNFELNNEIRRQIEEVTDIIKRLIAKGIECGELLPDENYAILGPLLKSQITNNLAIEELKQKYTPEEICRFTLITIFKGLVTPLGRDVLKRIEKENNI